MELENTRAQFLKLYASVPQKMRQEIIAVVKGRTYSWDSAFVEIHGKTELGNTILEKLDEIGMFSEDSR